MLYDPTLCFLLNKKELKDLHFSLINNNSYNIQYIKDPTEEMKLETV